VTRRSQVRGGGVPAGSRLTGRLAAVRTELPLDGRRFTSSVPEDLRSHARRRGRGRRHLARTTRTVSGAAEAGGIRQVPTFCDVCFWKCGAIATVKDGRLWKIEGNPDDPLSRGRLCPRGTGGVGAHFDPDR